MSPFLLSPKWRINFSIISLTVSPLNLTPKIPFNCEITIIMEVAVVKPDVTGVDIKSTKKPVNRYNIMHLQFAIHSFFFSFNYFYIIYFVKNNLPSLNKPISISTIPHINVNSTTYWGGKFFVYSYVSKDMRDVGPINTCLTVPKTMYMTPPISAVYNPIYV